MDDVSIAMSKLDISSSPNTSIDTTYLLEYKDLRDRNKHHKKSYDLLGYQNYLHLSFPLPWTSNNYLEEMTWRVLCDLQIPIINDMKIKKHSYFYFFLIYLLYNSNVDINKRKKVKSKIDIPSNQINYRYVFHLMFPSLEDPKEYTQITYPRKLRLDKLCGMDIRLFEPCLLTNPRIFRLISKSETDDVIDTIDCKLISERKEDKRNELLMYNDLVNKRYELLGNDIWDKELTELNKDIEVHTDKELYSLTGIKKRKRTRKEYINRILVKKL